MSPAIGRSAALPSRSSPAAWRQVKESGVAKVLEPMPPPNRKAVHDTVNEIDGVSTTSEGGEPNRRVVIMPTGADD